MKVYKKCETCCGRGWEYQDAGDGLTEEISCNDNCDNGYIETEIPIEQCLEALEAVNLDHHCCGMTGETGKKLFLAIKSAEEFLNE